jgi:hypothetical protein
MKEVALIAFLLLTFGLFAQSPRKVVTYHETFDKDTPTWPKSEANTYLRKYLFLDATIEKGAYHMTTNGAAVPRNSMHLDLNGSWKVTMRIKLDKSQDPKDGFGIAFGVESYSKHHSFLVNAQGEFSTSGVASDTVGWSKIPTAAHFNAYKYNDLAIEKHGTIFYYFVNGIPLHSFLNNNISNDNFGPKCAYAQRIVVDEIVAYQIESCSPEIQPIIKFGGIFATNAYAQMAYKPIFEFKNAIDHQFFGEQHSDLGIRFCSPRKGAKFQFDIFSEGWIKNATISGVLPEANRSVEIFPAVEYDVERLATVTTPKIIVISFRLSLDGKTIFEQSVPTTVYGFNTVSLAFDHYRNPGQMVYVNEPIGACIDEYSDAVNGIISEVENNWPVLFEENKDLSIAAGIWNALENAGVKYNDYVINNATSHGFFQEWRSHKEVLDGKFANCLDISYLYCAALKSAGLSPVIILYPGHAKVGYETVRGSGELLVIEATGIDPRLSRITNYYLSERVNGNPNFYKIMEDSLSPNQYESLKRFTCASHYRTKSYLEQYEKARVIYLNQLRRDGVMPAPR